MEKHAGCMISSQRRRGAQQFTRAAEHANEQLAGRQWKTLPRSAKTHVVRLLLV